MQDFRIAENKDLCASLRVQDFKKLAEFTKISLYNHLRLSPPAESPYFDKLLTAFKIYASTNEGKVLQLINRETEALSRFTTLQDKAFLTLLDNASSGENSMPQWFRSLERSNSKEKNLSVLVTVLAVVNARPELKHSTFTSAWEHRGVISYVTTYLPQHQSFHIPLTTVEHGRATTAETPNTEHLELEKVLSRFFRVERVITKVPFFEGTVCGAIPIRGSSQLSRVLGPYSTTSLLSHQTLKIGTFRSWLVSLRETTTTIVTPYHHLGCFPRRPSTRTGSCRSQRNCQRPKQSLKAEFGFATSRMWSQGTLSSSTSRPESPLTTGNPQTRRRNQVSTSTLFWSSKKALFFIFTLPPTH